MLKPTCDKLVAMCATETCDCGIFTNDERHAPEGEDHH